MDELVTSGVLQEALTAYGESRDRGPSDPTLAVDTTSQRGKGTAPVPIDSGGCCVVW